MSEVHEATMRRLAISKYMYMQGRKNVNKRTIINSIQTIINYDFAVETLLKTALLYKNIKLATNKGFKDFPGLLSDIRQFIKNETLIKEIESLHKTRNDVQHDCRIPSDDDLSRYTHTIKYLIDEICDSIFDNKVTFDIISLTFIVNSEIEKIIFSAMAKALDSKQYDLCILFSKSVIDYHTKLLQSKSSMPYKFPTTPVNYSIDFGVNRLRPYTTDTQGFERLLKKMTSHLEGMDEVLRWSIQRNVLPEYQNEISNLVETAQLASKNDIQCTEEDALDFNNLAYRIITETQWQLGDIEDRNNPQIFFCKLQLKNPPILRLGIAYLSPIASSSIECHDGDNNRTFEITIDLGYQEIQLEPEIMNYKRKTLKITPNKGDTLFRWL